MTKHPSGNLEVSRVTKSLFRLKSLTERLPAVDQLNEAIESRLQAASSHAVDIQKAREVKGSEDVAFEQASTLEKMPQTDARRLEQLHGIGSISAASTVEYNPFPSQSDPFAASHFAPPQDDESERRQDWRMNLSIKVSVLRVSKERLPLPQILDDMLTHHGSAGEALDVSFSGCAVAVPIRWLPGERLVIRLMAAQTAMGAIDAVAIVVRATDLGRGRFKLVCRFQAPMTASQLERLSWSAQDPWSLPTAEESAWQTCDAHEIQNAWASTFDELMRHDQLPVSCEI